MGESPARSNVANNISAECFRSQVKTPASKKMKPNNQVILSHNPFAPLAELEDMNTDNIEAPVEKVIAPPPIYVNNITNINLAIQEFRKLEPNTFKYASLNNKVKINFTTIEGYRKAITFLEEKKAEYYTYQLKSERAFRVVIRGLHHTTDVSIIKEELGALGYETTQVLPVLHPVSKAPLPMFFVDLKPNPKNVEIYNLNRLFHAVVKVEPPRPKRTVIQCLKCQEFGHTKNYCHKKDRCVKCDGAHSTQSCPKPPNSSPICTNCHGPHTANYRGCPVHVQLQKARTSPLATRIKHNPIPPEQKDASTIETLTYNRPISYAHALSSVRSPSVESSAPQVSQLMKKIDELLSLIQPLVSTLAQILPKLIKS